MNKKDSELLQKFKHLCKNYKTNNVASILKNIKIDYNHAYDLIEKSIAETDELLTIFHLKQRKSENLFEQFKNKAAYEYKIKIKNLLLNSKNLNIQELFIYLQDYKNIINNCDFLQEKFTKYMQINPLKDKLTEPMNIQLKNIYAMLTKSHINISNNLDKVEVHFKQYFQNDKSHTSFFSILFMKIKNMCSYFINYILSFFYTKKNKEEHIYEHKKNKPNSVTRLYSAPTITYQYQNDLLQKSDDSDNKIQDNQLSPKQLFKLL